MLTHDTYSAFVVAEDDGARILFPYYAVDTAKTHVSHLGGDILEAELTVPEAEQLLGATCPYPRR